MRLTAVDIHTREFTRCVRGYSPREVDEFRQEVADNFEEMQVELAAARDQIERQRKELDHYRALEKSMNESLIFAQRSADEVRANAHKEAELIIRNAENEAREIVARARSERAAVERQLAELESSRDRFLDDFGSLVQAVLERMESFRSRAPLQPASILERQEGVGYSDLGASCHRQPHVENAPQVPDWLEQVPGDGRGSRNGGSSTP